MAPGDEYKAFMDPQGGDFFFLNYTYLCEVSVMFIVFFKDIYDILRRRLRVNEVNTELHTTGLNR